MCRETTKGNTLELTWGVYLDYVRRWSSGDPEASRPAPLIQFVTWNDHAEASTLEPTRDYGRGPLELCKRKLAEARTIWGKGPQV